MSQNEICLTTLRVMQHINPIKLFSFSAGQEIPPLFMKFKNSLPCSRKSTTGPYLELVEFNPHPPLLNLIKICVVSGKKYSDERTDGQCQLFCFKQLLVYIKQSVNLKLKPDK
jgi:hypothetical protein